MATHSTSEDSTDPLSSLRLVPLPGSERAEAPGFAAHLATPVRPDAPVTATLVLRRKAEPGDADFAQALTSAQLAQQFGASEEDVSA